MVRKVGLKEQRERNNKSKVTQELIERKVNKKLYKKYKQEKKKVIYTNEERRENSKLK